jgi:aryl sulfotransferase
LSFPEQADIDTLQMIEGRPFFRIDGIFRMPIDDFPKYVSGTNFVWTHSPFDEHFDSVLPHFDRIAYIVRDPRDVAISHAHFVFTPYARKYYPNSLDGPEAYLSANLARQILHWVEHVACCLKRSQASSIIVVFYERLLDSLTDELRRLAVELGLGLEEPSVQHVAERVIFDVMNDGKTGHLRRGTSRQWTGALTPRQQQRSVAIAGPMLELLGFELRPSGTASRLPGLPEAIDETLIDEAVQHARTAARQFRHQSWRIET